MAKKSKSQKTYHVTAEEFVIAWNTSTSAKEVAEKVGMPIPIVHARASKYRKAGVRLKDHKVQSGRSLNVAKLNALIDEMEAERKSAGTKLDALDEQVVDAIVKKVLRRLKDKGIV